MYDGETEDTYGSADDEPAGGPSEDVSSDDAGNDSEGESDADARQ